MSAEKVTRLDAAVGVALGLAAGLLYGRTAPAVVNADGLGYVKLLPHNFAAGHLLYMPLLRLATAICHGRGLLAGRILSAASAGAAVALAYGCARALVARFPSVLAAAGLAVSYGVWVQGADVEVYAAALAALLALFALCLAYRAAPSVGRALAVGLALAGCVLFHLTHVIATPFVAAWIFAHAPSRRRALVDGALALATGGALTLAAYAWAALHVRRLDLAGAVKWIATAGHGFRYEGTLKQRLADAVYGLAKSFVWSPYLYESDAQTLLGQFLLGLAPLAFVVAMVVVRRRAVAALPWRPLAAWAGAYAAVALAFFGSDHERWIFVLPPLWLAGALAIDSLGPRRAAVGGALVAYLAAANLVTAIAPARRDTWARTRADAAAALMRDGDLVLFPGHSWDEYVGFYTETKIIPLPIAYYVARDGKEACFQRIDRDVAAARQRGARVFALRLLDDADEDSRGFFELESLGFPRSAQRAWLLEKFRPVKLATVEPKVPVWRLDDPAAPQTASR